MFHSKPTAKNKYAGGNPVCPRPTPTWQKGIGDFFGGPPRKPEKENQRPQEVEDGEEAGGSGMSKASRKYVCLLAFDRHTKNFSCYITTGVRPRGTDTALQMLIIHFLLRQVNQKRWLRNYTLWFYLDLGK